MAKPFFREFIKRIQDEKDVDYEPEAEFFVPFGGADIETDCEKYKLLNRPPGEIEEFEENEIFEEEFD
jgi:hypothetical protein